MFILTVEAFFAKKYAINGSIPLDNRIIHAKLRYWLLKLEK